MLATINDCVDSDLETSGDDGSSSAFADSATSCTASNTVSAPTQNRNRKPKRLSFAAVGSTRLPLHYGRVDQAIHSPRILVVVVKLTGGWNELQAKLQLALGVVSEFVPSGKPSSTK